MISESTPFNAVVLFCYEGIILQIYVATENPDGSVVAGDDLPTYEQDGRFIAPLQNAETQEVIRRVKLGTCVPLYFVDGDESGYFREHELDYMHWPYIFQHPFHAGNNRHVLLHELLIGSSYAAPTTNAMRRFTFPGIIEGATKTYYKRGDGLDAPDVRAVSALATAGWALTPPYGPHHLHSIQVTETPAGPPIVEHPRRAYLRRADEDAAIRKVARAWHTYWSGLTTSEQAINVRMTMREHAEAAIGRIWAARPLDDAIEYFKVGASSRTTRAARDAADWWLGNLEQWAYAWGFPGMALALAQPGKRATLQDLLNDHVFCHVAQSGDAGEQLANPPEGIAAADWTAWRTTHYNAALGTVVTADAGADAVVQSSGNYAMQGAGTIVNPVGPTVYAWEKVSGPEGGSLDDTAVAMPSFSAPTLTPGAEPAVFVYRLTVTNNGETATDEVTLRVASPVTVPASISMDTTPGNTSTLQIQVTGGVEPYTFAKTSGSAWITIDTMGLVTIATPDNEQTAVTHHVNYTVTDASGAIVSGVFQVVVNAA